MAKIEWLTRLDSGDLTTMIWAEKFELVSLRLLRDIACLDGNGDKIRLLDIEIEKSVKCIERLKNERAEMLMLENK